MSLAGLLCHEVTIVRPTTTTDRYGDAVKGTTGRSWRTLARVVQVSRSEDHDGREARVTFWLLYLPAGTDIDALDRVVWDESGGAPRRTGESTGALTFEVDGPPNRAPDRRQEHHVECNLTVTEG